MTGSERAMVDALMTYVDTAESEWAEVEPAYRRLTLVNDRDAGTRIVLVHYDAGYRLSGVDEHAHDEYLYVVSGTFVDQHRESGPGTFHPQPARVVASTELSRRVHLPGRRHSPVATDATWKAVATAARCAAMQSRRWHRDVPDIDVVTRPAGGEIAHRRWRASPPAEGRGCHLGARRDPGVAWEAGLERSRDGGQP